MNDSDRSRAGFDEVVRTAAARERLLGAVTRTDGTERVRCWPTPTAPGKTASGDWRGCSGT